MVDLNNKIKVWIKEVPKRPFLQYRGKLKFDGIGTYGSPNLDYPSSGIKNQYYKNEIWIIYTYIFQETYKTFTETSWPSVLYYSK